MDLFEELAAEASALADIPSDQELQEVGDLCRKLVDADVLIGKLESLTEKVKKTRKSIQRGSLPSLFSKLEMDKFGVTRGDDSYDLELKPYFHANIRSDWPEEQQEDSYDYLTRDLEAGSLIKTTLIMEFGREELDRARAVVALIRMAATYMEEAGIDEIPEPQIKYGVPWNTLTSFVREQYELRNTEAGADLPPLDLSRLGAEVGQTVKIKKRK